jgi:hypothetical protein
MNPLSKIKKIFSTTKETKKPIFQKLTPINNVDLTVYGEALDFVFKNNDLKNIAISGPYSSGKSSVIETYKQKHPKKVFFHISLAHFTEMELSNNFENSKISEPILEGKILNQLLHQINVSKIPQTDFKVKRTIPKYKIIIFTLLFVCSILFLQYLINFEKWSIFVNSESGGYFLNMLSKTITPNLQIFAGLFIIVSTGYFIFSAINAQVNKTIIKKLSFQGNNLELFDDKTESYFDKYLNEVLYIFNNSKADVIVFEDMDRYNANQIFVKLREINTLVNNQTKKIIRFFYLIRDDIFITKDRTKFFDYILPIVPVIDSSNSYDQFIKHFEDGGIIGRFDQYFLQELSLYIDDMRILKNIFNEYLVYYKKLYAIELDNDKLLAMIVYKNLFPRDFSELQLSKGYVYSLFARKPLFIEDEIKEINIQLKEIDERIGDIKNENLKTINELDTIFLSIPNIQQVNINNTIRQDIKLYSDIVKAMKENTGDISVFIGRQSYSFNSKKDLEPLAQNAVYKKREKDIEDKLNNTLETINQKKNMLKHRYDTINTKCLQDIITKENVDKIFTIEENYENNPTTEFSRIISNPYFPLIKYLIRNGYIDETYPDYMTYFYPNSITKEDKIFLRSITDKNAKEYNYKLRNIETVMLRLKPSYYEQEEILNFDLLSFLIKDRYKYEQYIKNIFNQLVDSKNIDFIVKFLENQKEKLTIIKYILKCIVDFWPNFLELFFNSNTVEEKQKDQFVVSLMNELQENDIKKLNSKDILTNYLSKFSEFLSQQKINIEAMISKLKGLSVKFLKFNHEGINIDFFHAVYKNSLYQLNFGTILYILEKIYVLKEREDILHKNYTSILSKPDEPLNHYIHDNINTYMDIILNNSQEAIFDDEKTAIKLLNNNDIEENNKTKYISVLKSVISNINDINDKEYWDTLILNNCIKNCENNILSYYFEEGNGLNEILIAFINKYTGSFKISTKDIDNTYGEDAASKFINDIIGCNEILNEVYEKVVSSSQWKYDEWDIFEKGQLSPDKISILINIRTILMVEVNLIFIREKYPDHVILFITKNIKDYIELINENNMIHDELLNLLEKEIDDNDKIELIKKTEEKISIRDKNYSEIVKIYILNNNFSTDDIPYLLEVHDKETENMKEIIIYSIVNNYNELINNHFIIPYNILTNILKNNKLDFQHKKELFANYIMELENDQIKECFKIIGEKNYLQLYEHKWPKMIRNSVNEKILGILKAKEIIRKYEIDKKNNKFFRVYGRR